MDKALIIDEFLLVIPDLGWQWGKTKYQLWSYLIPLIYALIAYLVIWVFGWGGFYDKEFVVRLTNAFGFGEIGSGFIILFYFILFGIFGAREGTF